MGARVGSIFTIDRILCGDAYHYMWRKKLEDLQAGDLLAIDTRPEGQFDYVYVVFQGLKDNSIVVDPCFDESCGLLIPLEYVTCVAVIDGATVRQVRSELCGAAFQMALEDIL